MENELQGRFRDVEYFNKVRSYNVTKVVVVEKSYT
jgi:hypothetical protein